MAAGRVGLRAHRFRFSACAASEIAFGGLVLPLGELAFGLTTSAFRHAPLRRLPSPGWFFRRTGRPSGSLLPLFGTHRFGVAAGRVGSSAFRFGVALGELVFGFTASAFRHAPIRSCPRRVGLRVHCFRFSARADSEWPLGGWPSGLLLRRLPFGGLAFGLTASEIPLGGLAFGFTASAFRHAPIRRLPSAGWPSGSLLPLFGMHRFAPPRRRSEDRRSTPTRHLFHFKTLIPTC